MHQSKGSSTRASTQPGMSLDGSSPAHISYEEEFEEMRCIGRGNFGAAFLVRLKNAPEDQEVYFIAKKVILGQLTDKEQDGAHLEVCL